MPYAKAQDLNLDLQIKQSDPAGYLSLNRMEVEALASYKKGCDVTKKNLKSTKSALNKCYESGAPADNWWADPKIVIAGVTVGFSLGVILGLAIAD